MASVVIRMGRSLTLAACSKASWRVMPCSCMRMAKSTSKMAFLVTSPISMTMPMMENIDSVEPNSSRESTTPISVSGSEVISAIGCRKLLNSLARIM